MNSLSPWLESLGVALLAVSGAVLGVWFSGRPKPWWLLGYFLPLTMAVLYAAGNRHPALSFLPPFSWMLMGRTKFAIVGFIASMVLTTPLSRLPRRRDRIVVIALMVVIVSAVSIWPFLSPAFDREQLAGLKTRMDENGICRQSTDYTCGPAAAVTALRHLGFQAEEGEIALLAHTCSATGTPPDILAAALQEHYRKEGLACTYRLFDGIAELGTNLPALVVVEFNFFTDHYLTVLKAGEEKVTVADPLDGLKELSFPEFAQLWHHSGIVLRRE